MKGITGKYLLLILMGLGLINVIIRSFDIQWDLTNDRRYTVGDDVQEMLSRLEAPLDFTILLDGDLPASFKGYRSYIDYYLGTLRRKFPNVEIYYKDPNEGSLQEANEFKTFLRSRGINGLSRKVAAASEVRQSELFPYVSIHYKDQIAFVDLLKSKRPGESEQEAIMRSQLSFEAEIIRTIRNISTENLPQVRIIGRQKQLLAAGLQRDERSAGYTYIPSDEDDLISNLNTTSAIIALVNEDLSKRELISLDQCALSGIPIFWFVDKFNINLDSINNQDPFLAYHNEFAAEDYWFKLGVKIQPALLYDLSCTRIPQVVGQQGGQPKTVLLPFQLHPLLSGLSMDYNFPLTTNQITSRYIAPLEVIQTGYELDQKVLLTSSPYTRLAKSPARLSFDMLRVEPNPEDYNAGQLPIAIEVSGEVQSYFVNRISQEDRMWVTDVSGRPFVEEGRMVQSIISDTDLILPPQSRDGRYSDIGYEIWERTMFDGNIDLLMNLLELNVYGADLLQLANRVMSNPTLDINKYQQKKSVFLISLLVLPIIVIIGLFGIYQLMRKRKYEKATT